MEQGIKQRLTRRDIWIRALFMVFFAIAYSLAKAVVVLLVLFQFVTILFTGQPNQNALKLGNTLSTYVYQILWFQTFNTESRPFPFSDWPDQALGDDIPAGEAPSAAPDPPADDASGPDEPDVEPKD